MNLKPSKPIAPKWLAYVGAIIYIVIAVLAIIGVVKSNYYYFIFPVIAVFILSFLSFKLSWYLGAKFYKGDKKLVYEVTEIIDTLGANISKYEINRIDRIKKHKDYLEIFGDITYFEPRRKGKTVKKMKLHDYNSEVLDMLEGFKGDNK
jgi:hypothetical protein